MPNIPIHNVGALGIVSDRPAHTLPPEAWSDARNMRFIRRQAVRMKGHNAVLGTPTVPPGFLLNVPVAGNSLWVYGDTEHVYVNDGGVHTQITRAAGATPYTAANFWDWNTCFIGGIPILNNGADVPQFWYPITSGQDLQDLTGWSTYPEADLRAKVVRSFGRFLIAMNTNDDSGIFPHRLIWSSQAGVNAVPASWDVNDPTVDTGQADLTDVHTGEIRDGLILGNQFYIYKEGATHVMRYVAGVDIMGFDPLFATGILATNCVCLIKKGTKHFVVTEDDVIVHSGVRDAQSVVEDKIRERLFTELNRDAQNTCFVFDNPIMSEAFFCYPTTGSSLPNRALVYDYKKETVSFRDWQGLAVAYGAITDVDVVLWSDPEADVAWEAYPGPWNALSGKAIVIADPDEEAFYGLDGADTYGTLTVSSFLERTGLALVGKDRQGEPKVDYNSRKQVTRVWPKITGPGAQYVQVQVGSQEEIGGTITWSLPKLFDPAIKYVDFDNEAGISGRLNAVRFESEVDLEWQCEGYDINLNVLHEM